MIRFFKGIGAFAAFLVLLAACEQKAKLAPSRAAQAHIDSMEKQLLSQMSVSAKEHLPAAQSDSELEQVLNLVKEYQLFSADFPKDTATPGYLLKEAQIFHNYLRDFEQADRVYRHLIDSFPQQKNRALAMYLLGNARHDAGDTAGAQQELRQVMQEYPKSFEAEQARLLADYIRKGLPKQAQP